METSSPFRRVSSLIVFGAVASTGVALGGLARALAAQSPGTVVVTVVDDTSSEPLEGVRIDVVGEDLAGATDDEGRAVLRGIPSGNATLRATLAGYGSVSEDVRVTADGMALLWYRLPRFEVLLEQLLVTATSDADARGRGHSEANLRGGSDGAAFLTAADLLAHRVTGLDFYRGGMGNGASIRIRGVSSIMGGNAPAIFLDGMRINDYVGPSAGGPPSGYNAFHTLEAIPASEVKQIRILRGPAATAQYAEAANGVILIETRRGEPGADDR
jgi:outer membrane receptor protein involved in Fe transport